MDLQSYFAINKNHRKPIAQACGVSVNYLNQVIGGWKQVNPARAVAIEKATDGAVTRKDLRPKDWHLIWPELAEK